MHRLVLVAAVRLRRRRSSSPASAGALWVRWSLRPLSRVAATATRVSELPLASGEVAPARPRARTSDPRSEVGRVAARLQPDARPRRGRADQAARERGTAAQLRRRRQPRAAHPRRLHPRPRGTGAAAPGPGARRGDAGAGADRRRVGPDGRDGGRPAAARPAGRGPAAGARCPSTSPAWCWTRSTTPGPPAPATAGRWSCRRSRSRSPGDAHRLQQVAGQPAGQRPPAHARRHHG